MKTFRFLILFAALLLVSSSCSAAELLDSVLDDGYYEDEYYDAEYLEGDEYYEDDGYNDEYVDDDEYYDEDGDFEDADPPVDSSSQGSETAPSESRISTDFCTDGNCGAACATNLEGFDDPGESLSSNQRSTQSIYGENGLPLIVYSVSGDSISSPYYPADVPDWLTVYQEDVAFHQELWGFFTTLIPPDQRSVVLEFQLMTDGEEEILASVFPSEENPHVWVLELDVMDVSNTSDFANTLIHEVGHLISLNPSQVPPSEAIFEDPDNDAVYYDEMDACMTYFPGEGCAKSDSYIYLFYREFWTDIQDEWLDIDSIEEEDEYYDALDGFYWKYEDQFVSDYAVTNAEEDFAETFSAFVLNARPEGSSIAEDKILFFYGFPELVEMRSRIAQGLCSMTGS